MKLGNCISARYTFELARKHKPEPGNTYKDVNGDKWYIESVHAPRAAILTDPLPDGVNRWQVVFRSEHPTNKISKVLFPIYERVPLIGYLERKDIVTGFGKLTKEGESYSWIFRGYAGKGSWELFVGDDCVGYNHFSKVKSQFDGPFEFNCEELPWDIITDCLQKF